MDSGRVQRCTKHSQAIFTKHIVPAGCWPCNPQAKHWGMLACQTANHLLLQRYLYKHKMCALWSQSCSLMIWCATPSFLRSSQAVSNHRYCLSMTADTWLLWVLQPFCTHTLPLSACFLTASSPLLPSCTLNCHTHKPPDIHTVTTLIYWHLPHCRGYAGWVCQCKLAVSPPPPRLLCSEGCAWLRACTSAARTGLWHTATQELGQMEAQW